MEKWKLLWYIGVILGIMENKMETTMVYWGYIGNNGKWKLLWYIGDILGIMENKMETTMVYWGNMGNNGK